MSPADKFGFAWAALAAALALHVADEALTDFLSTYNPAVRAIRQRLPFLPLPTFTFRVWLAGLCLGVGLLFALTPLAFRSEAWLVGVALPLSVLMLANGFGHLLGSLYYRRRLPGLYSSPVLVLASACLLLAALSEWSQK